MAPRASRPSLTDSSRPAVSLAFAAAVPAERSMSVTRSLRVRQVSAISPDDGRVRIPRTVSASATLNRARHHGTNRLTGESMKRMAVTVFATGVLALWLQPVGRAQRPDLHIRAVTADALRQWDGYVTAASRHGDLSL